MTYDLDLESCFSISVRGNTRCSVKNVDWKVSKRREAESHTRGGSVQIRASVRH